MLTQLQCYSNNLVFEMESPMSSSLNKKIVCEICEKTFTNYPYKERHLKIVHEEIKKNHCNVCDRGFGSKHELNVHEENNHQEIYHKVHKCKFCGKAFARLRAKAN